ncbi:uncharacterized protein LOC122191192 [Lagopus leucura]|uniref:uncharacterized protein LOC122191192 n=1 Tax=Lagopus leucura TaxID=30410 RepID=UPI001C66B07C|nr:uncharacterized protein LOC122191192 [Lagopus leucura]
MGTRPRPAPSLEPPGFEGKWEDLLLHGAAAPTARHGMARHGTARHGTAPEQPRVLQGSANIDTTKNRSTPLPFCSVAVRRSMQWGSGCSATFQPHRCDPVPVPAVPTATEWQQERSLGLGEFSMEKTTEIQSCDPVTAPCSGSATSLVHGSWWWGPSAHRQWDISGCCVLMRPRDPPPQMLPMGLTTSSRQTLSHSRSPRAMGQPPKLHPSVFHPARLPTLPSSLQRN